LKVTGGRPEYGQFINQSGEYELWIESIKENPVLCEFTDNSLVPIWSLCEGEDRKNTLEAAFNTLVDQNKLPELWATAIEDIQFVKGSTPSPAEGYEIIRVDLNRDTDVHEEYIWLTYKRCLDTQEAITDLTCIIHEYQTVPEGYTKIPQDLNEGARGYTIYLCYKNGISDRPIRQLNVRVGEGTVPEPGFYFVNNFYRGTAQDLNEDAGGNYIYITYSRDTADPWG
jgi:hypothetical protein